MRSIAGFLMVTTVMVACGSEDDDPDKVPCTPEGFGLTGSPLTFETVMLPSATSNGECMFRILSSRAEVDTAFPDGSAPEMLKNVDFTRDRILLMESNPALRFATNVENEALAIGREPLCQGIAPTCVAHIVYGTTNRSIVSMTCPYNGPEPCNAP